MSETSVISLRRRRLQFHYKVDHLLKDADREVYLAFIQRPTTTADTAHAWLTERGYAVSRSAVSRHRRHILEKREDRENSLDTARSITEIVEQNETTFTDASITRITELLFNRLMKVDAEKISFQELSKYADVIARTVKSYRDLEKIKIEREEMASKENVAAEVVVDTEPSEPLPDADLETRIARILNL